MTVGDILVSINQASLDTMLPLTAVQTSADIERYYKEGYSIGITATEFAKKYPRLPITRIYAARNMLAPLYYCELDNPAIPIVLSLNIYGDKRLAVNGESDEKFQQRVLDMAEIISSGNAPFIRSYLFSLEDSLRVSVLSKYIELSNPGEDLYVLFLDLYRTSDFGFSSLSENGLQKVFAGKSQKQKQDTEKKLSSLPDVLPTDASFRSSFVTHADAPFGIRCLMIGGKPRDYRKKGNGDDEPLRVFDKSKYDASSKNINGFIRRLPAGQKASERAILIAESYGYELKSDETYVTPFVRRQWLKKKTEE